MLHTVIAVARFIGLLLLFLVGNHYVGIAVDRWCDFCESLWEQGEKLKEPPGNP